MVLAATAGGDAASAAMITSQALSMDSQLRYSRSNEQEADRVGLSTMERANRDPGAVADMFATLLKGTRFTQAAAHRNFCSPTRLPKNV